MQGKKHLVWTSGGAALLGLLAGSLAAAAEIRLRSDAQIAGAVMRLGDVAEVIGGDAGERAELAAMELGPVASGGAAQFLRAREIQDMLAGRGVNLAEHHFSGASQVAISRSANRGVRAAKKPVAQPRDSGGSRQVVKAVRTLPRGAILQAADLELAEEKPRAGAAPSVMLASLEEAVGKETTQAIVPGQPLDADKVRSPLLVQKGEVVTVYSRAGGVTVRTTARAKEAGSQGALITVESLLDRSRYFARVIATQEVEVYAEGVSAAE